MSLPDHSIRLLIPSKETFTPDDLVEQIASVIYEKELLSVRNRVEELPELLKTIIWVIDFDTELSINGILGFFENSSGNYLNATIRTLRLIEAVEDADLLEQIEKRIEGIDFSSEIELQPGQITTFEQRHRIDEQILSEIAALAAQLYLSSEDRNIFDYLLKYLSKDWPAKSKELKQTISD
ncbi:DUF4375 domain-containing protein [Saccharibacillus sp. O23]|uniref:DMP19 family protein n=1 Tax=Saccharibacillus sp. O23 TaxID=2009338 RepID=UPI000B4E08FA|nr:DUF4375 domain-containing protein [Saccharibacillus sp. O23]OWR32316.1 DUF4375 domain-containing protein [Saccharibacillus sp. O23]